MPPPTNARGPDGTSGPLSSHPSEFGPSFSSPSSRHGAEDQEPLMEGEDHDGSAYDPARDGDQAHTDKPRFYQEHTDDRPGAPLLAKRSEDDLGADEAALKNTMAMDFQPERGRSDGGTSLLMGNHPHSRTSSFHSMRSTMRSHSPDFQGAENTKKKYIIAAFFLVLSLVAFVAQTELSAYVQQDLGWNKAYCLLYFTHGSWFLLWPAQLVVLRIQQYNVPWSTFWRRHVAMLRSTVAMVQHQDLDWSRFSGSRSATVKYLISITAGVTTSLTIAGFSWYIAMNMTTPSDLTAIYNCSAFFAYLFSVPLLKEPLRLDKSIAVFIAIVGVLIVAYGDKVAPASAGDDSKPDPTGASRFLGNIIIGFGSVLYGLYEVLYKRFACPPEGCAPVRGVVFANTFGSFIGVFTILVLWVPLPFLHWTGLETFELPRGNTALMVFLSVVANATFSGSFLVLISLTSPVLSSVASLLTIFLVALTDWLITGDPLGFATLFGGVMIMVAFLMLTWSTWREMSEHEKHAKVAADLTDSEGELEEDPRP